MIKSKFKDLIERSGDSFEVSELVKSRNVSHCELKDTCRMECD